MSQTLYVLLYPSRLFAAHWSFWLPYPYAKGRESDVGDRIHVTGNRLNGFEYEYIQGYNVREDDRKPNSYPIGLVSASSLASESDDVNTGIINSFDRACREVEAPGPSLNKVADAGGSGGPRPPPKKKEVKDCQWWIRQAVVQLVAEELLLPLKDAQQGETPGERVARLPRH